MSKLAKIIVTVIAIVIFFVLFSVNVATRQAYGYNTPGIFGLILLMGVIGAVKSIWKKEKNQKQRKDEDDSAILQK